jgi:hypothetical protein
MRRSLLQRHGRAVGRSLWRFHAARPQLQRVGFRLRLATVRGETPPMGHCEAGRAREPAEDGLNGGILIENPVEDCRPPDGYLALACIVVEVNERSILLSTGHIGILTKTLGIVLIAPAAQYDGDTPWRLSC